MERPAAPGIRPSQVALLAIAAGAAVGNLSRSRCSRA
jgi:hypothetical protein